MIFFTGCVSKQSLDSHNSIPLWLSNETINEVFPNEDYLAFVSYGKTLENARANADTELSSYFNQKIESSVLGEELFVEKNDVYHSQKNLTKTVKISTESDLIALRHTDPYYNKVEENYYICSYINRSEAWNLLEPKLNSSIKSFEQYKDRSKMELDIFKKLKLQNKALVYGQDFYKSYYLAIGIYPEKAESYSNIDLEIRELESTNFLLKNKNPFSIICNGDNSNRIITKIEELLSGDGLIVSQTNAIYCLRVNCNYDVQEIGETFVVYPQINILIETRDGVSQASFSKQLSKVSSYTKDAAERLALNKIEIELENNFIQNCFYD